MTDVPINPVTRRVQFTGNTGTGPYAFTFNILQASDIAVFKNSTTLTLTNDYTVAINANGTGSITLAAALIATDLLTITGGRELSRTTDFVTGGPLLASTLNEQLDSNVIMSQQLDEKFDRSLKIAQSDYTANLTLPIKSVRANQLLGFDASGNAVAGTGSTLDLTVANLTASSLTIPIGGSTVIEGFSFDSGKISTTNTNDPLELYANGTGLVVAHPGLNVLGNITLTGTADGRDLATDGTKLDGISAGATTYSFADSNGTVTITPAQGSAATLVIGTAAGSGGLAMRGNAGGADSVALGTSSNAIGVNAISIGKSATTSTGSNSPNNGIAIGEQAHSYGSGTTALGRQASAIGDNSIALGSYASVPTNYFNSVALGTSATVNAANQIMLGTSNKTVKIPGILNVDGNIVAGGTVDGRDLASDGTKLDGIEASADVTDATNVAAAGALMKSGGAMTGAITTNSTFDGRDVSVDGTKLDGIETNADVTDATNVNAAGAVMVADTSTSGMGFVVDEDNMSSNSATKIPTQQSVKAYVDSNVASSVQYRGSYNAATNSPNLDNSPSGITIGDMYTTTVAGTFYSTGLEIGDVLIAEVDDPSSSSDWTIVQQNLDAASIKTLYESNANTNAFDDAEQTKLAGIEAGADVNIGQYFMISANSQGVANGEIITTHPNASGVTSEVIDFTGGGATTVARSGNNLTFTSANTTYSFADENGTVTITPSTGSAATLVIGTGAGSGALAFRGNAGGANSIALGTSSNSMGINSIIIGNDAESTASGSGNSNNIGIGYQAHPYGANAIAIGYQAVAEGASGTALGPYANVPSSYYNSVALGISATVTASNQIMLGTSNKTVKIPGTLDVTGTVTANAGVNSTGTGTFGSLNVDTLNLNGSSLTASGNLTIDAGGDIILDADGSQIYLKDNGVLFGEFKLTDNGGGSDWDSLDIKAWGNASGNADHSRVRLFSGDNEAARFTSNGTTSQGQMTLNYPFSTSSGSGTYDLTIGSANKSMIFLRSGVSGSDADGTQYGEFSASSSSTELTAWNGAALNLKIGTETAINAVADGAVTLYHDNAAKLATTSSGVGVTGTITANTFQINSGGTIIAPAGSDLSINYASNQSLFFKHGSTTTLTLGNALATVTGEVSIAPASGTAKVRLTSQGAGSEVFTVNGQIPGVANGGFAIRNETDSRNDLMIDAAGSATFAGNVGIGAAPISKLSVADDNSFSGADGQIVMSVSPSVSNNESAGIAFGTFNDNDYWKQGIFWKRTGNYGTGELHFANRTSADSTTVSISDSKMMIDGTGNVGMGTTDPRHILDIEASTTGAIPTNADMGASNENDNYFSFHNSSNSATFSGLSLETRTSGASRWLIANEWKDTYLGDLVFRVRDGGSSSSEAMRIDASGRVGIGATSLNAGRGLTVANGAISVTSANLSHSTSSLVLSQNDSSISQIRFYGANTSTAGILQFDGSSSDGSVGGERMRIDASGHAIIPAGVTLGTSAGTYTAANTLDDYEEGTFQMTVSGVSSGAFGFGKYVKVGALVHWQWYSGSMNVTGSGYATLIGLPFTVTSSSGYYSAFSTGHNTYSGTATNGYVAPTTINAYITAANTTSSAAYVAGSSKYIMATGTYFTDL